MQTVLLLNFKNTNSNGNVNNGPQLKRIIKDEFKNIYGKEKLGNLNKNTGTNSQLELKPINMSFSVIIFLTSIIILLSILYYYRIEITNFL